MTQTAGPQPVKTHRLRNIAIGAVAVSLCLCGGLWAVVRWAESNPAVQATGTARSIAQATEAILKLTPSVTPAPPTETVAPPTNTLVPPSETQPPTETQPPSQTLPPQTGTASVRATSVAASATAKAVAIAATADVRTAEANSTSQARSEAQTSTAAAKERALGLSLTEFVVKYEGLTDLQRGPFIDELPGKTVDWTGKVYDVDDRGISIDMPGSIWNGFAVLRDVPEDVAITINKNSRIHFTATIEKTVDFVFFYIYLVDVEVVQ